MSKTALVFFTLVLVLAGCFIAGCSSLPFSGTPEPVETSGTVNVGLAAKDYSVHVQRFRFDEAMTSFFSEDALPVWDEEPVIVEPGNVTGENASRQYIYPEKHVKYFRAAGIDENGDAASWTFIVEHGDRFSIVTLNTLGVTRSTSPGSFDRPEIFIDQVLTPGELVRKNKALIFDTTGTGTAVSRDLTLSGGNYTVTISPVSGTPRILLFDAETGALISSND